RDWSSDMCSSDLDHAARRCGAHCDRNVRQALTRAGRAARAHDCGGIARDLRLLPLPATIGRTHASDPAGLMSGKLERTLRTRDLAVICVGTVIGSGIFIVPATVLRQTGGDPLVALAVWIIAGVLSLLGALTYGELGAMQPEAGGLYVYMRDGFGRLLAFLYGWTLFLVIASGSVATLAVAATGYLGQLVPLSRGMSTFAALALIFAVMCINVYGTRSSTSVQTWMTAFKVGAIVLLSFALIVFGDPDAAAQAGLAGTSDGAGDVVSTSVLAAAGIAVIAVLWAYEGWQYVTFSAGETINPQRAFPLGITIGSVVLIAIYCLANIGYVAA